MGRRLPEMIFRPSNSKSKIISDAFPKKVNVMSKCLSGVMDIGEVGEWFYPKPRLKPVNQKVLGGGGGLAA